MKLDFYLIWIIIPILFGFLSGSIGKPDNWYENLIKPSLNPPKLVFPIVWSILYILLGFAYYYGLYKKDLKLYIIPIIHLLLNFLYSPMFFYYKQILGSAILTLLILIFAILTAIQFGLTNKSLIPVYLFIPYILWLMFANYLSWSIYKLNK